MPNCERQMMESAESALREAGVSDIQKTLEVLDDVLKKVRSLECSTCHEHFGYSLRSNLNVKFCSTRCFLDGPSDQENRAVQERIVADNRGKAARNPMTPAFLTSSNLANGIQDQKVAEIVRKPERKPQEDFKGSSNSVASELSQSSAAGPSGDVTDNASTGSQPVDATVMKPERKPFVSAKSVAVGLPYQTRNAGAPVTKVMDLAARDVPPARPSSPLPAPVLTRPKVAPQVASAPAEPTAAPAPVEPTAAPASQPEPKRLMLNQLPISSNLYNDQHVVIQHSYAPYKFTITAEADLDNMEVLQKQIEEYSKNNPTVKTDLVVGEVVFAKYRMEDGSEDYYRALVTDITSGNKHKVLCLDYGDGQLVTPSDCLEPSPEIMEKHPVYGIVFTLSHTVGAKGLRMEDLAPTGYPYNTESEIYYLKIDRKSSVPIYWTGQLFKGDVPLSESLRKAVLQLKAAEIPPKPAPAAVVSPPAPIPIASQPAPAPVVSPPAPAPVVSPPAPTPIASQPAPAPVASQRAPTLVTSQPAASKPQPVAQMTSAPSADVATASRTMQGQNRYSRITSNPFLKPDVVKSKPAKQSVGYSQNIINNARVQIAFAWSNNKVTINAEADLAKIDELGVLVTKCIKPDKKMKELPELGDLVLAPYECSYYRGRVDSIEGDLVSVTFVDYGASSKVKYDECYEVDENVVQHPYYGRICKLKMVPDDLPDVTSPELEEALNGVMTLEVHTTEKPLWDITLKLDNGKTYNKLLLKAMSD